MTLSPFIVAILGMIALLGVGFYGLLACRNLIKIVIALQVLGKAALLGLIAAGSANGQVNLAQSLALTVLVADTIVAVMGIAIGVQIRRRTGSLDVNDLTKLRG
ncbi:MAG TPA: NADH-quinone oxidoreductase subunit K [Anaerolineales bacterium]|nr:NADH-quinone oxidoreductase subunit K [Anaerolineales bacterium]